MTSYAMQRRNREVNIFSLSALDLFCSALGAIMIITVIVMPYYQKVNPPDLSQELQAAMARAEAAEQRARAAEAEAQAAAQAAAGGPKALDVKVPLGLTVAWRGRGVDLDLYLQRGSEVVWAHQAVLPWGILTRDENTTQHEDNQETFFIPRFTKGKTEGSYEAYVAFYDWDDRDEGPGPFNVTATLFVFPGTPQEQRTEIQFPVQRSEVWDTDDGTATPAPERRRCKLAVGFRISLKPGRNGERDEDFQVSVTRQR